MAERDEFADSRLDSLQYAPGIVECYGTGTVVQLEQIDRLAYGERFACREPRTKVRRFRRPPAEDDEAGGERGKPSDHTIRRLAPKHRNEQPQ